MNRLKMQKLILLFIAIVFFIIGGIEFVHSKVMMAICTETAQGVIVDVEKRKVLNAKYLIIEYRAYTVFTPNGQNTETRIHTKWTRNELCKGKEAVVHYAPSNPDTAYIEAARPNDGTGMFMIGGSFLEVFIILLIISKKFSGTGSDKQDDTHWD